MCLVLTARRAPWPLSLGPSLGLPPSGPTFGCAGCLECWVLGARARSLTAVILPKGVAEGVEMLVMLLRTAENKMIFEMSNTNLNTLDKSLCFFTFT